MRRDIPFPPCHIPAHILAQLRHESEHSFQFQRGYSDQLRGIKPAINLNSARQIAFYMHGYNAAKSDN